MKLVTTGVLVLGLTAAFAADEELGNQNFTVTARGSYSYGSVDGFAQTPAGGNPGSSSLRRPTLHELKIDDGGFYDTQVDLRWRSLDFFVGYQAMDFDSSGTLSRGLVSQNLTFAPGSHFKNEDDFDWYRIGAGWKFFLLEKKLEIMPKADVAILDFNYKLSSGAQQASRSYIKGAGRLGLDIAYHLTQRVTFDVDGAASIPISNTPQIATATATVWFRLLPHSHRFNPSVFVGGGFERIEYEDNQPLPNHFKVDMGPFGTVGLAVTF
jgi:hypothetical protein